MKTRERDIQEIGHILKNVAQKFIGINMIREGIVRLESNVYQQLENIAKQRDAIRTTQRSIDADLDRVWQIINRNGGIDDATRNTDNRDSS